MRRTARLSPSANQTQLAAALAELRESLGVPTGFPADVAAEARRAAAAPLGDLPDLADVEFLTIDPPGSTDLDQALHLSATSDGFTVRYAIADVPFFVTPGGPLDAQTRRRGQTLYAPDGRVPLHPPVISEDAGSLLPDRVRRAFVWQFALDADGTLLDTTLTRALVRSRR
ncbi:RNB domain-containing ribonuclease, partial [Microbacterium sp. CPCC 204701]|uniref:RNB domain-containing ribonuclease n=1 Tax=Microbacterium sp. CPCC 204701 TaxID=2493084 RepID=UPI000FD79C54